MLVPCEIHDLISFLDRIRAATSGTQKQHVPFHTHVIGKEWTKRVKEPILELPLYTYKFKLVVSLHP